MTRIPFSLPDVGLTEIGGMVFVDSAHLVIKLESSFLGLIDTGKDVFEIEPSEVEDLQIKRGLLRDRLVIRPWQVDLLDKVPGQHRSALELRVWRKYRKGLEKIIEEFESMIW